MKRLEVKIGFSTKIIWLLSILEMWLHSTLAKHKALNACGKNCCQHPMHQCFCLTVFLQDNQSSNFWLLSLLCTLAIFPMFGKLSFYWIAFFQCHWQMFSEKMCFCVSKKAMRVLFGQQSGISTSLSLCKEHAKVNFLFWNYGIVAFEFVAKYHPLWLFFLFSWCNMKCWKKPSFHSLSSFCNKSNCKISNSKHIICTVSLCKNSLKNWLPFCFSLLWLCCDDVICESPWQICMFCQIINGNIFHNSQAS